jgi:hypothetical protein
MDVYRAAAEAGIPIRRCCRCPVCTQVRLPVSARAKATALVKKARWQARTLPRASRHGQPWTSRELEIAAGGELSVMQAARLLGRTYHAVADKRTIVRSESAKPWETKAQARTLDGAKRHGQPWTGPELEIAARDDLAIAEAALMIGRTYRAVSGARSQLRRDPRKAALAGLGRRAGAVR